MPPSKSFLAGSSSLGRVLRSGSALVDIPLVDEAVYGSRIHDYENELKTVGVMFSHEEACKFVGKELKERAASSNLSGNHVILMLEFIQCQSEDIPNRFLDDIKSGSWLKTSQGLRSPVGSVLHDSGWEVASHISSIPFIDQSYYGGEIYKFKKELKLLDVIVGFSGNYSVVIDHLKPSSSLTNLKAEAVLLLMDCLKYSTGSSKLIDSLKGASLLKTNAGYRSPGKCLLFDSKWNLYLKPTEWPFIDENFYGSKIASYKKELRELGVAVEVEQGCNLVASHLDSLTDSDTIKKIYRYLSEHSWKPEDKAAKKIWIPSSAKWVSPEECVIHDQDNLFGSKFFVLEETYDKKILHFFSFAMAVKNKPSVDDYVNLWNEWESFLEAQLSYDKCSKFWIFMLEHLNKNTEKKLSETLVKLPASSDNNEILLLDKNDVFVPDNLHLKKLFEPEKVIVWYPQSMEPRSRSVLFDLYRKIGVNNISESVILEEPSLLNTDGVALKKIDPDIICDLKVLVKLILGFLACFTLKMEPSKRHEAVQALLNLSFFEITDPITVSYSLSLSSGNIITKKEIRMVRWERKSSKFLTQTNLYSENESSLIKYATYFSQAISEGVLHEYHEHVPELFELITLAFVLNFHDDAIEFLMESKNLQIFSQDDEFLSSAFPSE